MAHSCILAVHYNLVIQSLLVIKYMPTGLLYSQQWCFYQLNVQQDMEEINAQVIEQDTIGDVDALISDVNNLDVEIEQLKVNLDTAKLKYNNSKAAEQEVEKQLSAVTSKLRSMNSSIDPLRVITCNTLHSHVTVGSVNVGVVGEV